MIRRALLALPFAAALPAQLTAHLLGFPEERREDIKSWSERLMRYDSVPHDPQAFSDFMQAIMEFVAVLQETAAARRECPADDLVTAWVQGAEAGCPMSDSQLVNETGLVISGGAETTRTVIARSLVAFAEHPDQWEALHEDPSLIPAAVEEMSASMGVRVKRVYAFAFAFGVLLAAVAGALTAPKISVQPGLSSEVIILSFAIVVIGGVRSRRGAAVGAPLVGVARPGPLPLLPPAPPFPILPGMAAVLMFRPEGLFRRETARRI